MGSRRKAREAAVQMLYQMDLAGMEVEPAIEAFWENLEGSPEGKDFANELVPAMDALRAAADALELLCDDSLWPLPRYQEMLFIR